MDEDLLPEEGVCDACGFEDCMVEEFERTVHDGTMKLCRLCSRTKSGNTVDTPTAYAHPEILQAICYVGNAIIKAIKGQSAWNDQSSQK